MAEAYGPAWTGRRTFVMEAPAADSDGWPIRHLTKSAELEAVGPTATVGDTLLHTDLRPDSMLRRADGVVLAVDRRGPTAAPRGSTSSRSCRRSLPPVGMFASLAGTWLACRIVWQYSQQRSVEHRKTQCHWMFAIPSEAVRDRMNRSMGVSRARK
ncbi:hypothetical protein [Nocardia sp. R7R-8]|uniref:hypothetical protein n=1 Tax=Nocardia sp. R7R-8 TaxID=3459304 RepID=UPI00403D6C88